MSLYNYLMKIDPTVVAGFLGLIGIVYQSYHNTKSLKSQNAKEFIVKEKSLWIQKTRENYSQYSVNFSEYYFYIVNGSYDENVILKINREFYFNSQSLKLMFYKDEDKIILNKINEIEQELEKTHISIISTSKPRKADENQKALMEPIISLKKQLDLLLSIHFKQEW